MACYVILHHIRQLPPDPRSRSSCRNPGARTSRASLRFWEFHTSEISVGSGRTQTLPDPYFVNRAYLGGKPLP